MLGNKIYFAGGDDDGYRKDCFVISSIKLTVKKLKDIQQERRNHTMVAFHIKKIIYMAGGYNKNDGVLNTVEKYDVLKGEWVTIAPMLEKRQWPGMSQFNNHYVYCFCGSNLDTIERLDSFNEEKGWEAVHITKRPETWFGRSACTAIQTTPTEILIFGGCMKHDVDHLFSFDPETRTLTPKTAMPVPSLFCQMIPSISGTSIGIQGWRNELIYIYDIIKAEWSYEEPGNYQPQDWAGQSISHIFIKCKYQIKSMKV